MRVYSLVAAGLLMLLAACGGGKNEQSFPQNPYFSPKALPYSGPEVDHVIIMKGSRKMFLMSGATTLGTYAIDLGFAPDGDKVYEGDGKTPEGRFFVDRKNPNSTFYLSIGINYPQPEDIAIAKAMGKSPGGDIFIHGGPRPGIDDDGPDWTAGCISISDAEISQIYNMVPIGTPVTILPD
ncbi:L,D-transpeptidase family protein [Paracoccaceae bacterium GXU_MW_L88]